MKNHILIFTVCLMNLLIMPCVYGNEFDIKILINQNEPIKLSTNNVFDALNYLNQKKIDDLYTQYSGVEPLAVNIAYQDVRISYSYPDNNNSRLLVSIPAIGFKRSFEGADRNESKKLALEALKEGGYLKRLQRVLVKTGAEKSEQSAVAGNTFGVLNNMVRNDFDHMLFSRDYLNAISSYSLSGDLRMGMTTQSNQQVNMVGISPAYHLKLSPDARFTLHLNMPIIQTSYGSQESYQANPSINLLASVNTHWQLGLGTSQAWLYTPNSENTVKYQGTNISNQLQFDWGNSIVKLINMIGQYETKSINGYNPELQHSVVKTGAFWEKYTSFFQIPFRTRLGVATSYFNGDSLQQEHVEELSLQLVSLTNRPVISSFKTEFGSSASFLFSLGIGI